MLGSCQSNWYDLDGNTDLTYDQLVAAQAALPCRLWGANYTDFACASHPLSLDHKLRQEPLPQAQAAWEWHLACDPKARETEQRQQTLSMVCIRSYTTENKWLTIRHDAQVVLEAAVRRRLLGQPVRQLRAGAGRHAVRLLHRLHLHALQERRDPGKRILLVFPCGKQRSRRCCIQP